MRRIRRILGAALGVALVACGGGRSDQSKGAGGEGSSGAAAASGGSGSAVVTYQPNVRVLEREEGRRALVAVSRDGSTLLLDTAVRPELRSLDSGDVLVIKGLLARKVLATEAVGAEIGVLTEPASIGEVVRDGRITLDVPLHFAAARARSAAAPRLPRRTRWDPLAAFAVPVAYAQTPDGEKLGKAQRQGNADAMKNLAKNAAKGVYEGWETTFSAVPNGSRLDISLEMKKEVGGFRAVITGSGYLDDFELASRIDVAQGVLERLELTHRRLNGVINFSWEVAKDTPGAQSGNDRIKLPAAVSIPLAQYLEGFPLFLEIGGAIIIQPAISGGKEYSQGSFRVTYDGVESFNVKEGNIDADGQVKGKVEFVRSQNVSALAPLGMVVAVAAPRIELTFGTSKLPEMFDSFKMDDVKEAAEKVDAIAEHLVKKVFGEEGLDRLKASPMGGMKLGTAVENALASDAVGYIEVVSTAGMTHTGFSVVTPCTRTELAMIVKVGASAQAFGQQLGEVKREIFDHKVVQIDPPGTRLCESVGR